MSAWHTSPAGTLCARQPSTKVSVAETIVCLGQRASKLDAQTTHRQLHAPATAESAIIDPGRKPVFLQHGAVFDSPAFGSAHAESFDPASAARKARPGTELDRRVTNPLNVSNDLRTQHRWRIRRSMEVFQPFNIRLSDPEIRRCVERLPAFRVASHLAVLKPLVRCYEPKKVSGKCAEARFTTRVPGRQNTVLVKAAPATATTSSAPLNAAICSSSVNSLGSITWNPTA